jgi:nickel/cobalt transporter (NicO) family protein
MADIESVLLSGSGNPWLLLPVAIALGALHALEPGHSKSLMVAFIVAIRGTARQAALLGVSAAVGHTIVIWILALLAYRLSDEGVLEKAEPWLLLIGGLLLIGLAINILRRFGPRRHNHDHDHHHAHDHDHAHSDAAAMTEDAHAARHEAEIAERFKGQQVSNAEVAWFGFTGGLMPCPSAFAVLLICLHQKAYGLGIAMVAAFSIGLAMTLVAVGVAAAWSVEALQGRSSTFDRIARWAPLVSALMVLVLGTIVTIQGARALNLI